MTNSDFKKPAKSILENVSRKIALSNFSPALCLGRRKKVEFLASSVVISNKSEWSTQKLLLLLTYYRVFFTYKKFREINFQYLPFVENVLCTDVSTYPNLSGLLLQLLPAP